ncbi:hypothetical protein BCR34DRAFT_283533 [Clohesyomyces aquaticus]|uniref:Uncharacterized protein n=1 Tax=Clohesyomyces aquaticus TaxID=1231657 RepID=A0A1Y1ZRB0_9PLEO|nr:hypothetical protein BCR34DRAFT_283533 [Clohesyomyces aquaticus]
MAELAASIFTLAKAATKLPDTLRIAISIIRSAESESRAIAADIQSFSLYLTQASKLVEDLDAAQTKTLHEISTILVPACHALIHKLEHLIGPLMPFGAKRGLVAQWVRFYYAWIVNRRDVAFIRELIESFKSTLGLLLTTMTLAVAIHREAPHDTW